MTNIRRTILRIPRVVAVLMLLIASVSFAQVPTATLSGAVHDKNGALLPGAIVNVRNASTGDQRTVTSNGEGLFSFPALASGDYDVTVSASGFSAYTMKGFHLDPNDTRALDDIRLGVASETAQLLVYSEVQKIDSTSGEQSSLITAGDIDHLAVEGRDVTELVKTLPGFAIVPGQGNGNISNTSYDPGQVSVGSGGAIGNYSANGMPMQAVSLNWDGANITDPGNYSGVTQNVNYDMVGEVKVQVANFSADQSHGPVTINAVSKSGGTAYHGDLYTYARTSQLNSADWLANMLAYGKPPDRYIYPGFDIGGPVRIPHTNFNKSNRVTFFAGAEDYAQRNNYAYGSAGSALVHALVPTAEMRNGDFSATQLQAYLGKNYGSTTYANITKVPTLTKNNTPVTNGNIASSIDPGAKILFNLLPTPNMASNGSYNYLTQNLVNADMWQGIGRVDVAISDRYKLFARYSIEEGSAGQPQVAYYSPVAPMGSTNTPGGGLLNTTNSHSAVANLTMILSATTVNEVFASFAYLDSEFKAKNQSALNMSTYNYPYQGAYATNGSLQLPQLGDYSNDGLPLLLTNDLSYGPLYTKKFLPDAGDNLTKVLGKHTLKTGVYVEQVDNNQRLINSATPTNGILSNYYDGATLTDVDGTKYYSSGNYLANSMEGIFGGWTQSNFEPNYNLYFWNVDGYVTDSWKMRNTVVLTAGIRVEHLGMWNDRHGVGLAIFDPMDLSQTATASNPLPGFRWHAIDPMVPTSGISSRFAFPEPRVGIAWDVRGNGMTVVRGGYGQYRYHDPYASPSNALSSSVGVRATSLSGSGGLTLNGISKQNLSQAGGTGAVTAYGLLPGDNETALTHTYSLAIDRVLPYKTQMELSYIGDSTYNLLDTGGQVNLGLSNVNALPYGALFAPVSGVVPTPYQVAAYSTAVVNSHRPYGTNPYNASTGTYTTSPYGSVNNYATISVPEHTAYSHYNGVQLSVMRDKGPLRYKVNYTFSKSLGILGAFQAGNPIDATNLRSNYGVTPFDRSQILSATYSYSVGSRFQNKLLGAAANGWEISGITQLQSGQNLQDSYGAPNFTSIFQLTDKQYTNGASTYVAASNKNLLGTTDIWPMPTLKCDPRSGLGAHQYINGNCFALGAQNSNGAMQNGPHFYPYMHGPAYFSSDLTGQRSIGLGEGRELRLRGAAFNFLNHPLPSFNSTRANEYSNLLFSGATPATAVAYPASGSTASGSQFGTLTLKQGRRVMEVSAKFVF